MAVLGAWRSLDPDDAPRVAWARRPQDRPIVVLLGAFDPPTNAHLDILDAAASSTGALGVLGLTKVRLARPAPALLDDERRVEILDAIALRCGCGLLFANRGTYLDVARALAAGGVDARFVVGADKLAQLADPSFYPDGERGVAATFDEVGFLVVPRDDIGIDRADVEVLEAPGVFTDPRHASLSASDVRRRIASGSDVSALVPPEVVRGIEGYTAAR